MSVRPGGRGCEARGCGEILSQHTDVLSPLQQHSGARRTPAHAPLLEVPTGVSLYVVPKAVLTMQDCLPLAALYIQLELKCSPLEVLAHLLSSSLPEDLK